MKVARNPVGTNRKLKRFNYSEEPPRNVDHDSHDGSSDDDNDMGDDGEQEETEYEASSEAEDGNESLDEEEIFDGSINNNESDDVLDFEADDDDFIVSPHASCQDEARSDSTCINVLEQRRKEKRQLSSTKKYWFRRNPRSHDLSRTCLRLLTMKVRKLLASHHED